MKQILILFNLVLFIITTGCSRLVKFPEITKQDYTEYSSTSESTEYNYTESSSITENTEAATEINVNDNNKKKNTGNIINNGGSVIQIDNTIYCIYTDNHPNANYAIYSMNLDGTEKKKILDIDFAYELFAADNYIIYNGYNDGKHAVFRYSIDTGELTKIADGELEYFDAEEKEIYYSVSYPSYDSVNYDWSLYRIDMYGNNNIVISSDGYKFVKKVDDTIYLEKNRFGKEYNDVVLASAESNGTNLKDIVSIPRLNGESTSFIDNEYIYGLDTYNDWIILTVGNYQGSASIYYGSLVKLKKDGSELERLTDFDTDEFYVIDNYIYFNASISAITGCYKYNIDSGVLKFLGKNFHWLLFVSDDKNLYYYYCNENTAENKYLSINDFKQCDLEGGNVISLFNGNDVPFYDDSTYISYEHIESVEDYIYFAVRVNGYNENESWRGHTCYYAHYRVKKDGTGLEMIYINDYVKCTEPE